MSFVSVDFVAFFAVVLLGLALMPTQASRLALLLAANFVFYAAGTPWFIFVLLAPAIVDYACALRIDTAATDDARAFWLRISLISNLGILFYFKYAGFFVENVAALFGWSVDSLGIVLPVGISFFTFKTMSYTIDVYRRRIPPCRSAWRYAMFVSFFPELVAGPIVRASVFLPQLERPIRFSWARTHRGIQMILLGATKKLLIADRLAIFVDPVFAQPDAFSGTTVASAVLAYTMQIYGDFSGYSDMAIGIAKIIGFDLPENFNMPYLATSITEFWRRWHITLSEWLRDYLYIPLGGNRRGVPRMYANLAITMLLGGLWHGAKWTFVLWGAWHGLGLCVHKWHSRRSNAGLASAPALRTIAGWAATFGFVSIGWVLFRAPDLTTALIVMRKLAGFAPGGVAWSFLPVAMSAVALVIGHIVGRVVLAREPRVRIGTALDHFGGDINVAVNGVRFAVFANAFAVTLWVLTLYLFVPMRRSPFIYFQF